MQIDANRGVNKFYGSVISLKMSDGWPREISGPNRHDEDAGYRRAANELRDMREAVTIAQASQVETRQRLYLGKDRATLLQYWAIVLERSIYPFGALRYRTFDYAPEKRRLIVDVALPKYRSCRK